MFIVKKGFKDLMDNGHHYAAGDTYPRKGYEPDEDRLAFLLSGKNVTGKPIIEEVKKPERKTKKETEKKPEKKPAKKKGKK